MWLHTWMPRPLGPMVQPKNPGVFLQLWELQPPDQTPANFIFNLLPAIRNRPAYGTFVIERQEHQAASSTRRASAAGGNWPQFKPVGTHTPSAPESGCILYGTHVVHTRVLYGTHCTYHKTDVLGGSMQL